MRLPVYVLLLLCSTASAPAIAESHWLLGAVAQFETGQRDSSSIEDSFLPFVAWENERVYIGIDKINVDLLDRSDMGVSLLAKPRYPSSTQYGQAELKRDFALESGVSATVGFFPWTFSIAALVDVTGVHGGHRVSLSAGQVLPLGPGELSFDLSVEYQSAELAMHLYGVTAAESSGDLTVFQPGAQWKTGVESAYQFQIGNQSALLLGAELGVVPESLTRSPRRSERVVAEGFVAIVRRF